MARTKNPQARLGDLLESATTVFRRKGFKRAQMSDVAEEMGCSTGTLYNYVDSKEALFEHVIIAGFTRTPPPANTLPLHMPEPAAGAVLDRATLDIAKGSSIERALNRPVSDKPEAEIREIVGDFFEFFVIYHPVLEVIEASWLDYPDLLEKYATSRQGLVFTPWQDWAEKRMKEGVFRKDLDAEWSVRYLIEMLAWGAWKARARNPGYNENRARDTIIEIAVSTLMNDRFRQ